VARAKKRGNQAEDKAISSHRCLAPVLPLAMPHIKLRA